MQGCTEGSADWDSQGTLTRDRISLWLPDLSAGMLTRRNRQRICLGAYGVSGSFQPPNKAKSGQAGECMGAEVTDLNALRISSSDELAVMLDALCPRPVRYRQVYSLKSSKVPLFAWTPVAPAGYVALGMVVCNDGQPPPLTAIRCVPAGWVVRADAATFVKLWDDSGTGGKSCSIWRCGRLGLIQVCPGGEQPSDVVDLEGSRYQLSAGQLRAAVQGEERE